MYAQGYAPCTLHFVPVDIDAKTRLGYWIEQARSQRGLTRQQLAQSLGVAYTTVYMWETGQKVPNMLMLGPLCEALGVEPSLFAELPAAPPSPVEGYLRKAASEGARLGAQRASRRTSR